MNKKFFMFPMTFIIILAIFQITVSAWVPDNNFYCQVDLSEFPKDTAYIDLLLPISSDDYGYTDCNQSSCEKFNISNKSQILNYNDDGYKSYTFHYNNSYSEMVSYYFCNFTVPKNIYNLYPDIFNEIKEDNIYQKDNNVYFHVQVFIGSTKEKCLEELSRIINIGLSESKTHACVQYCDPSDESEYGFEYLRNKYKTAKMAYLDSKGNVISVTNEVRIKTFAASVLNLHLSGNNFSSNPSSGPPIYLLFLIPIILFLLVILTAIILLICKGIKEEK